MTASTRPPRLRVLELYCGIGGAAAALGAWEDRTEVAAAIDVDRRALAVYRRCFGHPALARNLEGVSAADLAAFGADLWWLSPPCQPFTRRGLRRDDEDPRSRSLLALIDRLVEMAELGDAAPAHLVLENVPGFEGSRTHGRLIGALERLGYAYRETTLCPSELGAPNRRRRYYLAASRAGAVDDFRPAGPVPWTGTLRGLLGDAIDRDFDPALRVDPELVKRYPHALDIVHPDEPGRPTACFTAAYGRSPIRSGSYLGLGDRPEGGLRRDRSDTGIRRFGPREVLALLGFPAGYRLPEDLPNEKAWPLVGNSLSVPAVRRVLAALPPFARANIPP